MAKKKIRDLTMEDIPQCWGKLFKIDNAMGMCLIRGAASKSQEVFDKLKNSIPDVLLDREVEL